MLSFWQVLQFRNIARGKNMPARPLVGLREFG